MPLNDFLTTAIHAAIAAGTALKDRLNTRHNVKFKGHGTSDLVTEMDRHAEDIIVSLIAKQFPDHSILTEERGTIAGLSDQHLWIIDPLDGTTNYAHGFPWYAVSIALHIDHSCQIGVVYHPEQNELFHAIRGNGAFLNNVPVHVSSANELTQSLLATGFPYDIKHKTLNNIANFSQMLPQCQGIRRAGAAAVDLCYVACGRFDGFWELGLAPWDSAAGTLLITEAGGTVSTLDQKPFTPFEPSLAASNGLIHQAMLTILNRT